VQYRGNRANRKRWFVVATILEEFNLLKAKIHAGKGNDLIHVVDVRAERKRKLENPQESTRIMLNMRTPEAFREFHAEKERFFEIAVDPHIALMLMIRALHETSDEMIRAWLEEGERQQPEEPEWMK
jgi:hypothetical protein